MFRALADPTRRELLDRLFAEDGQSLTALAASYDMTRFGVMKHLRILQDTGLVVTRRDGRRTLHHLNAVPIREIHDRWISKYAEQWVAALGGMKRSLEGTVMAEETSRPLRHVYETYIRTTPERLWTAITDGEWTRRYFHGTRIESSWEPGSPVVFHGSERGTVAVEGVVREVAPHRRLSFTWNVRYDADRRGELPSVVVWEIEQLGDTCKLVVVHEFAEESKTYREVASGWNAILSSLKSLMETGEPLSVAS